MKPKVIKAWGFINNRGRLSSIYYKLKKDAVYNACNNGEPADSVVRLEIRILPNRKAR